MPLEEARRSSSVYFFLRVARFLVARFLAATLRFAVFFVGRFFAAFLVRFFAVATVTSLRGSPQIAGIVLSCNFTCQADLVMYQTYVYGVTSDAGQQGAAFR